MFAFDSFARVNCVDTYTDPNRPINGRVVAKELYKSVRLQLLDIEALNLKNGGTQKENSVSNLNSSISITLNDFDNFTTAGKTWLLYENYVENFSININIGTANNSTPQTWSLPSNFLTNFEGAGRSDFINMADVPLALRITGANKFMRTAYYDENDRPMNVYDQYNLANDGVYHVGESYDLEVGSDDAFDEVDYEVADVPLDLNDTFTSTNEETNYLTNLKTSKEIHSVSVNAFGAITTPTGTYNCLRMMSVVQKYTRPNESSSYTLVSTTNHITFFTKTGEYFTAKVSGTSGNVTASEITYRSVVQTSSLSENKDVKLNNDSKGVTINNDNDTAHPSSILDVKSDSLGVLIPRISMANRPSSPATGLLVYQIDNTPGFYYFDGSGWKAIVNNSSTLAGGTQVNGANGLKVSTTNPGSGTNDWIAVNAGGSSGDRVVSGNLLGKATIGGHNNTLTAWSDLTLNQGGGSVIVGGQSLTPPTGSISSDLPRPLVVNGSVRQSYYSENVNISANSTIEFTWTHNLGYSPIVMMNVHQTSATGNMENCTYTSYPIDNNSTRFIIKNMGSSVASGNFRWILVH